jgi:hypothetical protein
VGAGYIAAGEAKHPDIAILQAGIQIMRDAFGTLQSFNKVSR